ncbi:MAG: hypothetical protein R8K21_04535 [Mariprofundales bacterium]
MQNELPKTDTDHNSDESIIEPFPHALYILKEVHQTGVSAAGVTPSTARMYYRFTKCFLDYCKQEKIEPDEATIDNVQSWLSAQKWKSSTINSAISALRWSCQYTHNHIPGLSGFPTHRAYFPVVDDLLTEQQLVALRLLSAIALSKRLGLRNRAMLLLVIDTLADEEEVQKLCVEDIRENGSVHLILRNKKIASPVLAEDTQQALQLYLAARLKKYDHCEAYEPLFISEQNRCMSSPTMWRVFHKATQLLTNASGADKNNMQTSRTVDSGFSLVRASQARQLYIKQQTDIPKLMAILRKDDANAVLRIIRELV